MDVQVTAEWCDTCGHRALIYANHHTWTSPLDWCGHHGAEALENLNNIGATVIDLRHTIHP